MEVRQDFCRIAIFRYTKQPLKKKIFYSSSPESLQDYGIEIEFFMDRTSGPCYHTKRFPATISVKACLNGLLDIHQGHPTRKSRKKGSECSFLLSIVLWLKGYFCELTPF